MLDVLRLAIVEQVQKHDNISLTMGQELLKAVQSFYIDSRACVRVGNDLSEWFPNNVGLRQGCVMSLWLFSVYMDCVV